MASSLASGSPRLRIGASSEGPASTVSRLRGPMLWAKRKLGFPYPISGPRDLPLRITPPCPYSKYVKYSGF